MKIEIYHTSDNHRPQSPRHALHKKLGLAPSPVLSTSHHFNSTQPQKQEQHFYHPQTHRLQPHHPSPMYNVNYPALFTTAPDPMAHQAMQPRQPTRSHVQQLATNTLTQIRMLKQAIPLPKVSPPGVGGQFLAVDQRVFEGQDSNYNTTNHVGNVSRYNIREEGEG